MVWTYTANSLATFDTLPGGAATDSFTLTLSDGNGGTMQQTISVDLVNDPTRTTINSAPVFGIAPALNTITRVSTDANGSQVSPTGGAQNPTISPDGTKAIFYANSSAFFSWGSSQAGLMMKDLVTGAVTCITTDSGNSGFNNSGTNIYRFGEFSPDGTQVAFWDPSSNLTTVDTNGYEDIFIKNLTTGAVTMVDTDANGNQLVGGVSVFPVWRPNSNQILFRTQATGVPGHSGTSQMDLYLKDLNSGSVTLVSGAGVTPTTTGNGNSFTGLRTPLSSPTQVFSSDGNKLVFSSYASNFGGSDTNGFADVFVKDLSLGTITNVSLASDNSTQGNGDSLIASITPDGTKVLFESVASNLVGNDTKGYKDLFIKNLNNNSITRINTNSNGNEADGGNSFNAQFSSDGTKVLFMSDATNLVANDTDNATDLFVKDLITGTTTLVAQVGAAGLTGQGSTARFSTDGTKVIYQSDASNLVGNDSNNLTDIFTQQIATAPRLVYNAYHDITTGTETTQGYITFTDNDFIDIHTATATAKNGTSVLGGLTLTVTDPQNNSGIGKINWSYSVTDAALSGLSVSNTASHDVFTITLNDGNNHPVTQDLTFDLINPASAIA